jgi:hypothetical protein
MAVATASPSPTRRLVRPIRFLPFIPMEIGLPETEREIEIAPLEEPVPEPVPAEEPVEEPVPA